MKTLKSENSINSFLDFSAIASNILHIKTAKDYAQTLETIEDLFSQANDKIGDPLHDLIDLISRAIEKYELSQDNIIVFEKKANDLNQEISTLKVLMQQHNLTLSDLKDEIGSKSLVSMILHGKGAL